MLNRRDSLSCDMDEETRPYVVCFVGLEKTLETQLSELVPDAHILRFTTPALSALHIDNAALDLLKYLYDNYTLADHQDGWRSVVLVGKGVASFIVKQAMNLASTQEQYRELALMVSDLVFIETPHRTFPKGPSWSSVLEAMLSPDLLPLQDEFVSRIKLICGSFLLTAKKHRISNILAASSNLRINEYDCRIFDYWLETNIHLTADLVASDLSDRFDDLHRVRRVLSQPDVQKEKSRFPTSAYIDFLSDLSWSWRQPGDYGYRENKRFTVDAHSLHTQPDGISLPLQLVGPAGCGKKTMLRHLADTRSRSLQSTAVILVKEDFCSFNPLQKDVLKSMISQILWQRPFVFPHLQAYLDTASDIEIPTEPMLWNVLRFLCHPGRIGTLYLYIADISDSPLVLRPLLQFLQSSESPANLCVVSTSKAVDLTNLPADTRVIDVLDDCDWDQGILTVIDALLPMYPWLEETALQCEVKEKLRQCTGDYLTAYLYLKQSGKARTRSGADLR
ncbi:uncharacterized protein BDV14DRAFT_193163 [Aspergillus stella-maris]|uniref:uncharacterized protein n=1 Tax=Aspergillus stella-maris TaxID=1810926 RepID=UPI003CCD5D67